jgi:hypothetical protein
MKAICLDNYYCLIFIILNLTTIAKLDDKKLQFSSDYDKIEIFYANNTRKLDKKLTINNKVPSPNVQNFMTR